MRLTRCPREYTNSHPQPSLTKTSPKTLRSWFSPNSFTRARMPPDNLPSGGFFPDRVSLCHSLSLYLFRSWCGDTCQSAIHCTTYLGHVPGWEGVLPNVWQSLMCLHATNKGLAKFSNGGALRGSERVGSASGGGSLCTVRRGALLLPPHFHPACGNSLRCSACVLCLAAAKKEQALCSPRFSR